ncbi:MAG: DUF4093 domain-containing protein [Oscillospiraceae bacterium]|nr:DUF4093 domain-containing protein [Oscillospiraceae bacterium]
MERLKLSRIVIVEGKYDKIRLEGLIEGTILTTDGFRIYRDKSRLRMLRELALKRGAAVVTDSDQAGFQLRGFLRSVLRGADLVQVYIPQLAGKEKRKRAPGAEGLLGVEGMALPLLEELFRRAGALDPPGVQRQEAGLKITREDFYQDGFSGGPDAARRREALLKHLGLPNHLSAKALLEVINSLIAYPEYRSFADSLSGPQE